MKILSWKIINLQNLLLLGILTFALLLRLWGIESLGLPRVGYVDDEPFIADAALRLLRQDRLDFSQWDIGAVQIYLQALIGKIVLAVYNIDPAKLPTYKEITTTEGITALAIGVPYPLPQYYFWGRAIVAILGGVSTLILYLIGKEISSSSVGLMSAFFLAVNSIHIEYSHYLMRTVPAAFFLLLAFYIILLAYLRQKWLLYLFSFLLVYIAIYTKQNNLVLLSPFSLALLMIAWYEFRRRSIQETVKFVGIIFSIAVVGFSFSWYFFQFNVFVYIYNIFARIFFNSYVYGGYDFGLSGQNTPQWFIDQIFLGPSANWRLIAFLAIPGLVLTGSLNGKGWLLFSILLPYSLLINIFTFHFIHWLIPIIPFLAIMAALTLDWIYKRIGQMGRINQNYLSAIFCIIIILISSPSIRTAVTLNYYGSQPDVRNIAGEWLQTNLPPHSKVVIDSWGPYLDTHDYDVTYVYFIGNQNLQLYQAEQVDYLVINSINLSRILSAKADPRADETVALFTRNLTQITTQLPLEHKFVGPALLNPPVVEVLIYKIPKK